MNKDIDEGEAKQVKGKVREEAGKAADDTSMEMDGAAEQVLGKIQEEWGKAKRDIKKALDD